VPKIINIGRGLTELLRK